MESKVEYVKEWDSELVPYKLYYSSRLQAVGLTRLPENLEFHLTRMVITAVYRVTGGTVYYDNGKLEHRFGYGEVRDYVRDLVENTFYEKVIADPPKTRDEKKTYIVTYSDIEKYLDKILEKYKEVLRKERIHSIEWDVDRVLKEKLKDFRTSEAREKVRSRAMARAKELVSVYEDNEKVLEEVLREIDTAIGELRVYDLEVYVKELEERVRSKDEEIKRLRDKIRELEEKLEACEEEEEE